MTAKTNHEIIAALSFKAQQMNDAADAAWLSRDERAAETYRQQARDAEDALEAFGQTINADALRWYQEAEDVKRHLLHCCECPGAMITITVRGEDGRETTAKLFDHAALVQSLIDALEDFQSEI